jgi:hypothetical protein
LLHKSCSFTVSAVHGGEADVAGGLAGSELGVVVAAAVSMEGDVNPKAFAAASAACILVLIAIQKPVYALYKFIFELYLNKLYLSNS